jgi:hypothetical protein
MVPVRFTVVEPAAPESIPIDNRFTANDRSGFIKGFHEKLIHRTLRRKLILPWRRRCVKGEWLKENNLKPTPVASSDRSNSYGKIWF